MPFCISTSFSKVKVNLSSPAMTSSIFPLLLGPPAGGPYNALEALKGPGSAARSQVISRLPSGPAVQEWGPAVCPLAPMQVPMPQGPTPTLSVSPCSLLGRGAHMLLSLLVPKPTRGIRRHSADLLILST